MTERKQLLVAVAVELRGASAAAGSLASKREALMKELAAVEAALAAKQAQVAGLEDQHKAAKAQFTTSRQEHDSLASDISRYSILVSGRGLGLLGACVQPTHLCLQQARSAQVP